MFLLSYVVHVSDMILMAGDVSPGLSDQWHNHKLPVYMSPYPVPSVELLNCRCFCSNSNMIIMLDSDFTALTISPGLST